MTMGTKTFKAKSTPFGQLTREEVTQELAEAFTEGESELAELTGKFDKISAFCADLGMPKARTWATLVVTTAEALELDLDDDNHLAAACMLAAYQVRNI